MAYNLPWLANTSASGPTVLSSALTAQKQDEGTANYVATASVGTAGVTLLSWDAGRTVILTTPVAANNGNTYTQQFSQNYGAAFTNYTLRGNYCYSASGTANHAATGTKTTSTNEEATIAILVASGGQIGTRSAVVQRDAAGAGATLTSGTVTTTAPALLVAVASGNGDVNATAPTQTWPGDWTVLQSVAFSSAQAPTGHIPLYLAVKSVTTPGTYSVDIQMTINEGAVIGLYALQ